MATTTNGAQANVGQTRHPATDAREGDASAVAATDPSGSAQTASSREGMQLGKYTVGPLIGNGGIGAVHEGQDTFLKRKVAIKLLPDSMSRDPSAIRRFVLEARAFARVNHPNAVQIYEVDRRHGICYLVMELMRGGSMQDLLESQGALPWPEATQAVADACRALIATHAARLVHRDIKPSNLMRSADGVVKLADFGLARETGTGQTLSPTMPGGVVGTPGYMSPEQCRSEPVDARSDLYALGATYYHLLTGRPPYEGELALQVLFAHCSAPVPDPRAIAAEVPEACAEIVRRAMAKEPRDRYPTTAAMLLDLEATLSAGVRSVVAADGDAGDGHADSILADLAEAVSDSQSGLLSAASGSGLRAVAGSPRLHERLEDSLARAAAARTRTRRTLHGRPRGRTDAWLWGIAAVFIIAILLPVGIWHRGLLQVLGLAGEPRESPGAAVPAIPPDAGTPPKMPAAPRKTRTPATALAGPVAPPGLSEAGLGPEGVLDNGITLATVVENVSSVAFSRDGMRLACGGGGGVKVWESEHAGDVRAFCRNRLVRSVAFAPGDDRLVAAACQSGVWIRKHDQAWESNPTGGAGGAPAWVVAFSPDAKLLAAVMGVNPSQRVIRVWNVESGEEAKKPGQDAFDKPQALIALAFSADSGFLAAADDQGVSIWAVGRWNEAHRRLDTGGRVNAMAFSPDGTLLAVACERGVQFWDARSWSKRPEEWTTSSSVKCVAFTSDATLLACGTADGLVRTWEPAAGRPAGPVALRAHQDGAAVVSMDFMPRTRILVTGGADNLVRLFDLDKSNDQIAQRATTQPVAAAPILKPAARPAAKSSGGGKPQQQPAAGPGANP